MLNVFLTACTKIMFLQSIWCYIASDSFYFPGPAFLVMVAVLLATQQIIKWIANHKTGILLNLSAKSISLK